MVWRTGRAVCFCSRSRGSSSFSRSDSTFRRGLYASSTSSSISRSWITYWARSPALICSWFPSVSSVSRLVSAMTASAWASVLNSPSGSASWETGISRSRLSRVPLPVRYTVCMSALPRSTSFPEARRTSLSRGVIQQLTSTAPSGRVKSSSIWKVFSPAALGYSTGYRFFSSCTSSGSSPGTDTMAVSCRRASAWTPIPQRSIIFRGETLLASRKRISPRTRSSPSLPPSSKFHFI